MEEYIWETSSEINKALAQRVKKIRKIRKITQKGLSEKCHVSYGTIKYFEQTGNISLSNLTKIAIELGIVNDIKQLFSDIQYNSIKEVINGEK